MACHDACFMWRWFHLTSQVKKLFSFLWIQAHATADSPYSKIVHASKESLTYNRQTLKTLWRFEMGKRKLISISQGEKRKPAETNLPLGFFLSCSIRWKWKYMRCMLWNFNLFAIPFLCTLQCAHSNLQTKDAQYCYLLSLPPRVGIGQFARLLASLDVVAVPQAPCCLCCLYSP